MGLSLSKSKQCTICYDKVQTKNKYSYKCGNMMCKGRFCLDCVKHLYGTNKPGSIISIGSLLCPACRREPKLDFCDISGNGGKILSTIKLLKLDPTWIYIWCSRCNQPDRLMKRICAGNDYDVSSIINFLCDKCLDKKEKSDPIYATKQITMYCPGCGTATKKTYGCNHMKCVCGQNWCYQCGKGFLYTSEVNIHMDNVHGTNGYVPESIVVQ
jgi:hypothetical protein